MLPTTPGLPQDTTTATHERDQLVMQNQNSHPHARIPLAKKMAATILHRPSTLNAGVMRATMRQCLSSALDYSPSCWRRQTKCAGVWMGSRSVLSAAKDREATQ